MSITKTQIIKIHTLLNKEGELDNKADIVSQFSTNGEMSTKALNFDQANDMIEFLGGKAEYKNIDQTDFNRGKLDNSNGQHMFVYSLVRQLGWTCKSRYSNKITMDNERFGRWLFHSTEHKKALGQLTPKEVSKVISQLQFMLDKI